MKKYLFFLMILPLVFSCSQENELNDGIPITKGLNVSADFINLANTGSSADASSLIIRSNEKDVTVKWITGASFNIDTTQTVVSMKNGQGVLPIKWQKKLETGSYAPENMMFKAGVIITAGEFERYIPLYHVQNLDSTLVKRSIQTRAEGNLTPKISSIEFLPLYPAMSDLGATVLVRLTNLTVAQADYSSIKSFHNIDVNPTDMPTELVEGVNTIKFKWKDANVRPAAFKLPIVFSSFELVGGTAVVTLEWDPGTPPEESIKFISSSLPANNIPQTGGNYSFTFEGSYIGSIQVRALSEGVVLVTGPADTNMHPQLVVPANAAATERAITFEYLLDNGEWTALPATTNRTQDGTNGGGTTGTITASKIIPAGSSIPEKGNTYYCQFKGGPGTVIFRAVRTRINETTGQEVVRSEAKAVPATIGIKVPDLNGLNATISFEYSIDGGQNWISLNDNRLQENTWAFVSAPDANTRISATKGSITFTLMGDADLALTIYARSNGVIVGQATGYFPSEVVVPVEDNPTATERQVSFSWSLNNGTSWSSATYIQAGK